MISVSFPVFQMKKWWLREVNSLEFGRLIMQLGLEPNSNFKAHVLDLPLLSLISFSSASYYFLFPFSFVCHSYLFLILFASFTHSYKLYFLSWQRGSGLNHNFPFYFLYALPHTCYLRQVELCGLPKQTWSLLTAFHAISFPYGFLSIMYVCGPVLLLESMLLGGKVFTVLVWGPHIGMGT